MTGAPTDEGLSASSPESPLNAVLATSLADEAAFQIESAILNGTYPPGSHLRQDELSHRFGISRTPVREALRKLQARNLVVLTPNKGATVRVPTRKELSDIYEVRSELEGYSCELTARRVTGELAFRLDEAHARLTRLVERPEENWKDGALPAASLLQISNANDDFHDAIHRLSGNDHLRALIDGLGRSFPKDYFWRSIAADEELRTVNVIEHGALRDALVAGKASASRRLMKRHILHARSVLLNYLDGLNFWS